MRKPLVAISLPLLVALSGSLCLAAQARDGVVAGRVLTSDGSPAAGMRVAVVSLDSEGRVAFLGRPVRDGRADADGVFRIDGVPEGRYGVAADPDDAPTYFPGTYDASLASVITVRPGDVTSGIDFSLPADPPTVWTGIGFIGDQPGPSLLDVPGRIVIEGLGDGPARRFRVGDGLFELFFSDGYLSRTGSVAFPLGSAGDASTTLEVGGAGRSVFWYVTSAVPMPWAQAGAFRLLLPEGDYRVAPAGTPEIPGFYIKALSYGDADVRQDRMRLRSNRIDEFVITLAACPAGPESPCDE
jgi:hypothetical protein